jgi:hypothetical protein
MNRWLAPYQLDWLEHAASASVESMIMQRFPEKTLVCITNGEIQYHRVVTHSELAILLKRWYSLYSKLRFVNNGGLVEKFEINVPNWLVLNFDQCVECLNCLMDEGDLIPEFVENKVGGIVRLCVELDCFTLISKFVLANLTSTESILIKYSVFILTNFPKNHYFVHNLVRIVCLNYGKYLWEIEDQLAVYPANHIFKSSDIRSIARKVSIPGLQMVTEYHPSDFIPN